VERNLPIVANYLIDKCGIVPGVLRFPLSSLGGRLHVVVCLSALRSCRELPETCISFLLWWCGYCLKQSGSYSLLAWQWLDFSFGLQTAGKDGVGKVFQLAPAIMRCKPSVNDRWDRRVVELAAFLLRHGHCNVPEVTALSKTTTNVHCASGHTAQKLNKPVQPFFMPSSA
jgi:hypothetical protein